MITPKVSQYINLYEYQEHVHLSAPCLIILVTINAMEELILNAQYMWTHPPLV